MDHRTESFRRKFASAAQHLSVEPKHVVSLKLREDVRSYNDYVRLMNTLTNEEGLVCSEIGGDLQGRGYLISDGNNRLILVEHETGLELLYIAGSVASLIGIIPLILQGWHVLRGRFGREDIAIPRMQIRQMDNDGRLHEEYIYSPYPSSPVAIRGIIRTLFERIKSLEIEVEMLNGQVETLTRGVDEMKKQNRVQKPSANQKNGRRTTGHSPRKRTKK